MKKRPGIRDKILFTTSTGIEEAFLITIHGDNSADIETFNGRIFKNILNIKSVTGEDIYWQTEWYNKYGLLQKIILNSLSVSLFVFAIVFGCKMDGMLWSELLNNHMALLLLFFSCFTGWLVLFIRYAAYQPEGVCMTY